MWCISEVNFPPFSRSAAWRIRSSACLTRARPCIRCMSRCGEFPLTRSLLSTASAAGRPALFGRFFDSMGLSDSSGLCIIGYAFRLPSAPQIAFDRGEAGGLPDSSNVCPHMHGVSDPGWPQPVSRTDVLNVAFRLPRRRRHHRLEGFRGSTPSLCVPLSTLRPQPHDRRRMTRGRGGLLGLPRMALSSTTLWTIAPLEAQQRGSRPADGAQTVNIQEIGAPGEVLILGSSRGLNNGTSSPMSGSSAWVCADLR